MARTRTYVTLPATTLVVAIAAVLAAAMPRDAHALRVNYTLDFGVERNDNLLLTPTDPLETTLLRPGLGVELLHDTSVLQMHLSGRAEYRHYDRRGLQDGVDGTFSGRVNWVAIPERLSFSVVDQLTLQPVDTLAADAPGNRQQVNVLSAGPTLQFEWGDDWRGSAELRWIRSEAEVTDEFDSQRADLALRATRRLSPGSRLSFNLQHQRVDFDSDLVARDYDRTQVFARWTRTLNRVDMAVDLGYSRLDYRRALTGYAGGRSDPMFRGSLAWRPNDAHRFDLAYSSLFSDVASDSLADVGEEGDGIQTPPTGVPTGDTVVNASPFLERRLEGEYAWTSTRWTFSVSPFLDRLRYEDTDQFDQDGYGVGVEAGWRARRNLRIGFTAALDHNRYVNLDREDETRRYALDARYQWVRHWSGVFTLARYERRSTEPGQRADQNVVSLALTYHNR
ncbi:MAG: hypothetical protein KF800_02065 [Lysobacter sp.]|nr:hypothetical protein [Lysobacter sp.]